MKLASQLRAVFALYIVMVAAVLVFHVRGNRRGVERARTLTALAQRQRDANDRLTTIGVMRATAEKYLVTRDSAYLARLTDLAAALDDAAIGAPAPSAAAVHRLLDDLEGVELTMQKRAAAAESAMALELAASDGAARAATRVSWIVAGAAIVLSAILSVFLVRAIASPLARLARGTREISAGRFGHRLRANGRDEFADVSRDFNAMAERLEELDRLKKDFVSTVSHDLKTPLSSMQETVEVMLDELPGPLNEKQRKLLALNRESARRLGAMLSKLLDLSRLESQNAPETDLVDVTALVRDVVDRVTPRRSGGASIALVAPAGRLLLHVDATGVAQVLENLLENALKFSPAGGTVRVALADLPSRGTVLLSVADEGPGVPDAEKERVFERFHQTATGRAASSRGVGLGLAICRRVVESHGGVIWVADHEPRGAVFCVLLPGPAHVPAEHAA